MKSYKGQNVRVTDEAYSKIKEHLTPKIKIGEWVAEAAMEKIARETKKPKRFKIEYETK